MGSGGMLEAKGSVTPGIEGISGGRDRPLFSAFVGEASALIANSAKRVAMRAVVFIMEKIMSIENSTLMD
jgi:hypothetical protein